MKIRTVDQLWKEYLNLVGLSESRLGSIQRSEMKKAYFGAVGQILMLVRDDITELSEDDAVKELDKIIEETKQFWIVQSLPYN